MCALQKCPEYAEIPVRHNEEIINEELNRLIRFKLPRSTNFESPHTKACLLYQAFFSRMSLQTDYLTDQRSILESCIRIVQVGERANNICSRRRSYSECTRFFQAFLDFAVVKGWLQTAISTILFLQQVIQGRWADDHPLLSLPRLSADNAKALGTALTVPLLQEELGIGECAAAPAKRQRETYEAKLRKRLRLDAYEARDVVAALLQWPILRVVDANIEQGATQIELGQLIAQKTANSPLTAGASCQLKLAIQSIGPARVCLRALRYTWCAAPKCAFFFRIRPTFAQLSIQKRKPPVSFCFSA